MAAISQGCPARCTGTTILGSLPAFSASASLCSSFFGHKLYVCGSMSTKSTCAPQYKAQLAEATNVLGDVQSQSPGPRPSARQEICSADVALLTATACLAPVCVMTLCSNWGILGPCVRLIDLRTPMTASISACVMSCCP